MTYKEFLRNYLNEIGDALENGTMTRSQFNQLSPSAQEIVSNFFRENPDRPGLVEDTGLVGSIDINPRTPATIGNTPGLQPATAGIGIGIQPTEATPAPAAASTRAVNRGSDGAPIPGAERFAELQSEYEATKTGNAEYLLPESIMRHFRGPTIVPTKENGEQAIYSGRPATPDEIANYERTGNIRGETATPSTSTSVSTPPTAGFSQPGNIPLTSADLDLGLPGGMGQYGVAPNARTGENYIGGFPEGPESFMPEVAVPDEARNAFFAPQNFDPNTPGGDQGSFDPGSRSTGSFGGFGNGSEGGGFWDSLSKYGDAFKGVGSLVSAYTGYRQMRNAEDQFEFQKRAYNRNLANRAALINDRLEGRNWARAQLGGRQSNVRVNGAAV